jgi:hypothetical protein
MGLRRLRRPLVAAAVLAGLALTECGGGSDSGDTRPSHAGGIRTPIRLADCTDWRSGDVRERFDTVRAIRKFAGGPAGSGGHGAVLEDRKAYKLFESYCAQDLASGFKLYKLYTRAAAFSGR